MASTHQVLNQPPALTGHNGYLSDTLLVSAVRRSAPWAHDRLSQLGALLGSDEAQNQAREANRNLPVLHTHDRFGNRRDEVTFHPAWHQLMRTSVEHAVHSLPWTTGTMPAQHPARAALMMVTAENELGHTCPISMTYSGIPALRQNAALAREWEPRFTSTEYDPSFGPADRKRGALMGMGMTEKQGGSDVRANTTFAEHVGGTEYLITGHKWFCSAPMPRVPGYWRRHRVGCRASSCRAGLADWEQKTRSPIQRLKGQTGEPVERIERGRVSTAVTLWLVGEEGARRGKPSSRW